MEIENLVGDGIGSLIHIYIIHKSGILIFEHSFVENNKTCDPILVSGVIVGTLTIFKEIIKGESSIKTIDHGDRIMIFETNSTKEIIFVLIIKEEFLKLRKRFNAFIKEFDKVYEELISNIGYNCSIPKNWESLDILIGKHFKG